MSGVGRKVSERQRLSYSAEAYVSMFGHLGIRLRIRLVSVGKGSLLCGDSRGRFHSAVTPTCTLFSRFTHQRLRYTAPSTAVRLNSSRLVVFGKLSTSHLQLGSAKPFRRLWRKELQGRAALQCTLFTQVITEIRLAETRTSSVSDC